LNVEEDGGHLKSSSARVSEEGLAAARILLNPRVTLGSKRTVAGEATVEMGFSNVKQLTACHVRAIEWNRLVFLLHDFWV
jgi:hypothetical protein